MGDGDRLVSIAQARQLPLQRISFKADPRKVCVSIAQARQLPLQPYQPASIAIVHISFNRSSATIASPTVNHVISRRIVDKVSIAQARQLPLQPIPGQKGRSDCLAGFNRSSATIASPTSTISATIPAIIWFQSLKRDNCLSNSPL